MLQVEHLNAPDRTTRDLQELLEVGVLRRLCGQGREQQEHQEELGFLQEVMQTDVMQAALQFMVDRGILSIFHKGIGH